MSWVCRSSLKLFPPARAFHASTIRKASGSASPQYNIQQLNRARRRGVYVWVAVGLSSSIYLFWPAKSRAAPTKSNASLSPSYFTPAKVTLSEPTGPDTKLIELTFPPHLLKNLNDSCAFHPIWSICIKDDDIQVERPYTPLEGIDQDGRMKFWVKKYSSGEVGRWLHSRKIGDSIEIRGPVTTWSWKDNEWDEVVMISGGTGITPFYQLLHHVFDKEPSIASSKTHFTLLHSSRAADQLPPSSMLQTLHNYTQSQPKSFSLRLFVDSRPSGVHSTKNQIPLSEGRIGKSEIQQALSRTSSQSWGKIFGSSTSESDASQRKVLFLVCGPDQMISAIAGPFGRNLTQGDVGGFLGELGYKSEQVWKL
ncbi:ferredoxin reductase-like protein [Gloeophyllum trabeum ATCC 11539]|uniref:Ferredoxin reductase-like protein n=1 Tax=Gloeophyllum trabeum (strain ATCC 11539 / FP-39264 / Madison 617) TaxID=670483 RepID=S7S0Y1_GLOTA|nr:ferredoxin reductase-like protein [Gloeophyllum trabeum ATCC 11539]EPQ59389.1 ferredoxin reductase-like protein [Gloeophyllum trabeum ATCC 11539]